MDDSATISDLGDGAHRITLPLPWALDHVHCYALEAADGWTIIDAGLGTPGTLRRWEDALARLGSPRVRRLVISHYHPDHIGASAGLVALTGATEVVQGRLDRERTLGAWLDPHSAALYGAHLAAHGMPAEEAARAAAAEDGTPVEPALPTRLVDDGDLVEIGTEDFRVLVLGGHADGLIALHGERSGRLFASDAILDPITPNVGRWEDTDPDPLGRFLASLERIAALRPSIVHPGHRATIHDAGRRGADIRAHHDERLAVALAALRLGARSAYEVGQHIWGGRLGFHEQRFALVEAISHLERLVLDGRAVEVAPFRYGPAA